MTAREKREELELQQLEQHHQPLPLHISQVSTSDLVGWPCIFDMSLISRDMSLICLVRGNIAEHMKPILHSSTVKYMRCMCCLPANMVISTSGVRVLMGLQCLWYIDYWSVRCMVHKTPLSPQCTGLTTTSLKSMLLAVQVMHLQYQHSKQTSQIHPRGMNQPPMIMHHGLTGQSHTTLPPVPAKLTG